MPTKADNGKKKLSVLLHTPLFWWSLGYLAVCFAAVFLVYYWRVFFYFDRFSALGLTAAAWGVGSFLYAAVFVLIHYCKKFEWRAAGLIVLCGILFCFANPPLQTPDEGDHFLRAYAISMGRLDFDAERGYPSDVDILMSDFYGAYTNGNGGDAIKQYYHLSDPEDSESDKLPDGPVRSIADCFTAYSADILMLESTGVSTAESVHEPLVVMLLPYIPQMLGILLARLLGFRALGCLYAGRLVNLLLYAALCMLALKNIRRHRPVFLGLMLLPMSIFMAASLSYDAMLLGLYWICASFILRAEFTQKNMWQLIICIAIINIAKPWLNLLWVLAFVMIPKKNWKAKTKPGIAALLGLAAALAATAVFSMYGRLFRYHYGDVGRMLGSTVDPTQQLLFILSNPLRYLAVLWGTLCENTFFLPGLGSFGALDTLVPTVGFLSVLLLAAGCTLSVNRSPLKAKTNTGLAVFGLLYAIGVFSGLYITYTPVGMIRVIGLQARYFLPVVLSICLLLTQALNRILQPHPDRDESGAQAMALAGFGVSTVSALLLFETYFIGPVTWVLSEVL